MLDIHPWDLVLSGHTHGGQVVMPGLGINPAPVWDRAYIAGLKR
jgi:predicted MPP superfamily phosphohydrolase